MQISLSCRVHVNEAVLLQEAHDEAVLLKQDSGVYFGLDQLGTRIWVLMLEHELLADIAGAILSEYDVTEDRCTNDLVALVADLEHHGLVTVSY